MHGGSALGTKLAEELHASMAATSAELIGMQRTLQRQEAGADGGVATSLLRTVRGGRLEADAEAARPHLRTIAAAQPRISAQLQSFLSEDSLAHVDGGEGG
jgi:hypothetical protein